MNFKMNYPNDTDTMWQTGQIDSSDFYFRAKPKKPEFYHKYKVLPDGSVTIEKVFN